MLNQRLDNKDFSGTKQRWKNIVGDINYLISEGNFYGELLLTELNQIAINKRNFLIAENLFKCIELLHYSLVKLYFILKG